MSLKAPFPWFGGKSRVADVVWRRFGDVPNYVEPSPKRMVCRWLTSALLAKARLRVGPLVVAGWPPAARRWTGLLK